MDVDEHDGVYHIQVELTVDAPRSRVWEVLTDYRHVYRLNPSIIESEVLPGGDQDLVRVRTRIQDCALFFCMSLERVEEVQEIGVSAITARILPASSDFKSGSARWSLAKRGARTLLLYEARMEPGFFVPPLLGTALLKSKLREQTLTSLSRLECIARAKTPPEERPSHVYAQLEADGDCDRRRS